MWKAATDVTSPKPADADDWETDPDFVNDITEHEQRWGPEGRNVEAIDMAKLREEVLYADTIAKKKQYEEGSKPSFGYGGKFGVQVDRMDKSAVGHDYVGKIEKHASQKDYAQGFGGKFGVQTDRVDKSAAGWKHREQVEKHSSQTDYSLGFGGKFGVQADRQDVSAIGWNDREETSQHHSQTGHIIGFGGKFGVQTDRQDASAMGSGHQEKIPADASQVDHKKEKNQTVAKEEVTKSPELVARSVLRAQEVNCETVIATKEQTPPSETNLPDVTLVGVPREEREEITRQPTIVVSPVGWEAESAEADADDEDGYTARALYDYQATAADEISFDPDDVITNIVMIDEGWWQGLCKGAYGLFPANYVQLLDKDK